MATSDAQPALAAVLDWLFAANVDPSDAFAAARSLLEAGVDSRSAIAALTPERVRALTNKKVHRKLLTALRKMPTLDEDDGVAAPSPKRAARDEEAPPPPPPPPAGFVDDPLVNRSPVMVLWAAACAVVEGHDWPAALSLGSSAASIFARAKGSRLGIYSADAAHRPSSAFAETAPVLGELVPIQRTREGVRGLAQGRGNAKAGSLEVVRPAAVFRYLRSAYGSDAAFGAAWHAMVALARAVPLTELRRDHNRLGYDLYTRFRPQIAGGLAGWGQAGRLPLGLLREIGDGFRREHGVAGASTGSAGAQGAPAAPPQSPPPSSASTQTSTATTTTLTPGTSAVIKREEDGGSTAGDGSPSAQERAFGLICERAACGGIGVDELSASLCGCQRASMSADVVPALVEALQLTGAIYERDGRLLPL